MNTAGGVKNVDFYDNSDLPKLMSFSDLSITKAFLKKLFLLYNYKKEVSGYILGDNKQFFFNNIKGNLESFVIILDCVFFKNINSTESKSKHIYKEEAIGYFHSHISGNLNLSFVDKFLLFLFWIFNQNLSLVYGRADDLFILIFYVFTLRGIKIKQRIEFNFIDLFNQFSKEINREYSNTN